MILTQLNVSLFGIPAHNKALRIGRYVTQTIDLAAPIVLLALGILSLTSVIPISPIFGYVTISVGCTLGLSQFFMVLIHHVLTNQKLPTGNRYHTTNLLTFKEHLDFYKPYPKVP